MTKKLLALSLAVLMILVALPVFAQGAETVTFTDSAERDVEVPAPELIERIVPSGGMAQIVLFSLAPEYFVALATGWSEEAEEFVGDYYSLPVLGQLYGNSNLNLEELAAADPQIVVDIGEAKQGVAEDMDGLQEQIGIPAVHVDAYIETMGDAYRMLGGLLGLEERAETLAAYCEEVYGRTEEIMAKIPEADRVKMMYLLGEDGLNAIAKGSYHAQIIDMLADNLAVVEDPSSRGTGNPIDMEQLLLWNPEIIVFAHDSAYDLVADDAVWQALQAIQNGKYVEVPFGPYNWMGFPPSVQRYLGILWLTDLFYPEMTEYDLQAEIIRYYDLFYHTELAQEQYDRLMENAFFK